MGLGQTLYEVLGSLGPVGLALALYLLFVIDAAIFPALPEVWLSIFFFAEPVGWDTFSWGLFLLLMAVTGEATGNSILYRLVRDIFVARDRWPRWLRWLERIMKRWTQFLVVSDERIILVNRIAPVVPFTGAFIAVLRWDFRKSLAYIVIGAAVKYAFLLVLFFLIRDTYPIELAPWITFGLVLVVVAISAGLSFLYRRRLMGKTSEEATNSDPPQ